MVKTKYYKKIEDIDKMFKRIQKEDIDDLNEAIQYDNKIRFIIKRVNKLKLQLKKRNNVLNSDREYVNKLKREVQENVLQNINYIVSKLNKDYHLNINLHQFDNDLIYNKGILYILKKNGYLDKIYSSVLNDIMPKHPKDEYQETRIMKRKFYIHTGPTNCGKTYQSIEKLKKSNKGIYLAPLRLLAIEIYEKLNYEGIATDLLTGEEEVSVPFAYHKSCTVEKANFEESYDLAVIDECQMIQDKQRGNAWTRAILGIKAKEIHLICATHSVELLKSIIKDCDDEVEVVEYDRKVPLTMENELFAFPYSINKGDALIVFSRKQVIKIADELSKHNIKASMIYGNLPPETRRKQIDLFTNGETEVIVSTDAIGMGLNLPIKRVVFLESKKFDGFSRRLLNTQEVKQIAGRAGRQGLYEEGLVNTVSDKEYIKNILYKTEDNISKATLSPLDKTIMSLPIGSLSEKLSTWNKYKINVSYIQKIDITEQIGLLHHIERYSNTLTDEMLLRCIMIPFNQKNEMVLNLWLSYVGSLVKNKSSICKPYFKAKNLFDLETYYNQINLYYSFSRKFDMEFDYEWIKNEREKIAEKIHQLIKNQKYK